MYIEKSQFFFYRQILNKFTLSTVNEQLLTLLAQLNKKLDRAQGWELFTCVNNMKIKRLSPTYEHLVQTADRHWFLALILHMFYEAPPSSLSYAAVFHRRKYFYNRAEFPPNLQLYSVSKASSTRYSEFGEVAMPFGLVCLESIDRRDKRRGL